MTQKVSRRAVSAGLASLAAFPFVPRAYAQTATPAGAPISISLLFATPSFFDLPVFALTKIGNEYGLNVNMLELQGGGSTGSVFAGGQGDLLFVGISEAFAFNRTRLVEINVFGALLTSALWSLVVPAQSPAKTIADLKGKSIGISGPGASSDTLVRWAVRSAGLDPNRDVQLIALGSVANLYAGIENKRVDAAVLAAPVLQRAVQEKIGRVIGDWENMSYPGSVLIARSKDLKATPEKYVRFLAAFKDVLHRFKDDRAFALKIAKLRYPSMKDDDLSEQLDHAIATFWNPMDGRMTHALYDRAREVALVSGQFKEADIPSFDQLVISLPDR